MCIKFCCSHRGQNGNYKGRNARSKTKKREAQGMKKKIIAALMTAVMVFSMAGCAGASDDAASSDSADTQDQEADAGSGETKEIFENPKHREAARLTGCKNFSSAQRLDAHTVRAVEWGITIHTQRDIPEETSYIGYRAHDFIPIWGERGENMLKFYLESSASLPFEHNFYLRPEGEAPDDMRICWFVQQEELKQLDERGMPDYLALDEGSILFLE